MFEYARDAVLGISLGIALGLAWLYALRPHASYPSWMLLGYRYPWIALVYLLVVLFAWTQDRLLGAVLLLLGVAVVLDVSTFGSRFSKGSGAGAAGAAAPVVRASGPNTPHRSGEDASQVVLAPAPPPVDPRVANHAAAASRARPSPVPLAYPLFPSDANAVAEAGSVMWL